MASSEGCSPYALSVGFLIGIFIGREDIPEADQVCMRFLTDENSKCGFRVGFLSSLLWAARVCSMVYRVCLTT